MFLISHNKIEFHQQTRSFKFPEETESLNMFIAIQVKDWLRKVFNRQIVIFDKMSPHYDTLLPPDISNLQNVVNCTQFCYLSNYSESRVLDFKKSLFSTERGEGTPMETSLKNNSFVNPSLIHN